MATATEPVELNFPKLPARHDQFIQYVKDHPQKPMAELLEPYKQYDAELRKAFARQPDHPAVKQSNLVPVFSGQEQDVKVRARDPQAESEKERDCYIMPLKQEDRKPDGAPAVVQSLKEFQTNFSVFSESSLADLDWSNVVVGGSAVVTSLLSVPEKHNESKRALRQYYHEQIAPASDVDLFLYGLTEEQAMEKIKQIEQNVRDALLVETTTVRMKNAITIASKHPVRHVQIVLRIYKSISEILTGFDVDCSCAAYDGKQVYVSPRALAAYMTQTNTVDLTRRSPSYENRLSKYAHRGFEVYWPELDRSRIDPTIFERSFGRTEGLARLLILEKLPRSEDRDSYLDQRRAERGRPPVNRFSRRFRNAALHGNIKDEHEDEVAEWVDEEVADYHTVTVPYGPKFHARKIEKLLFTKDMLLNAEWNKPKDREVNLHRHPAFFGSVDDVIGDCCGHCPEPRTGEEEEVAEEESKKFVKGGLTFMKDDPGRQAIGSFNPLDAAGWTEMAYVGNTALLCQAIIDEDLDYVNSWLVQEGNGPNARDYTGRTPLHLAVTNSSPEIVQALIDHGARMVARLVDGRTALHLAAMRGNVEMVSALLRKSAANEEENEEKIDARRAARKAAKQGKKSDVVMPDADKPAAAVAEDAEDADIEMVETGDMDTEMNDATTEGDMVDVGKLHRQPDPEVSAEAEEDEPDIYDVNVVAWDTAVSPLHLAIVQGHVDVVKCLVQEFGADVLLPIKLFNEFDKSARAAVLTIVLGVQLGFEKAQEMVKTLIALGASTAQADVTQKTALHYCVADRPDMLDTLIDLDPTGIKRAINHLSNNEGGFYRQMFSSPLMTAIEARDTNAAMRLLFAGAKPAVDFSAYMKAMARARTGRYFDSDSERNNTRFQNDFQQPIIRAANEDLTALVEKLIENGADVNTLSTDGWTVINDKWRRNSYFGKTLLDIVRGRIEELKNWEQSEPRMPKAPKPLKGDADYLADFKEGTYSFFAAKVQVGNARSQYERDLKSYKKQMEEAKTREGTEEKQRAIENRVSELEQLEKFLLDRGAKTFYDLHPDIQKPESNPSRRRPSIDRPEAEEFAVNLDFWLGNLTDETRERCVRLFEAAWSGDTATVKDMTSSPWKDKEGNMQPPSIVATLDKSYYNPFSLAVAQGHLDLASTILEIAHEQHVGPEQEKSRKYGIDGQSEDENSDDSSEDGVQLFSEVVDDEFTKEDVGQVSLKAETRMSAVTLITYTCDLSQWAKALETQTEKRTSGNGFSYFGPRKPHALAEKRISASNTELTSEEMSRYEAKTIRTPQSLFQLAMYNNDPTLLAWLLKLARQYARADKNVPKEKRPSFYEIGLGNSDYSYALEVGRPHLFMELAKQTGMGLPIDDLVKEYGVEVKEKPKYYQGLTVRGKKRQDWAKRGREMPTTSKENTPPMLASVRSGSLELVEWWLSDAPLRCYNEFAAANQDDKRIQRLLQSDTGFESAVQKFLTTNSQLAIHNAVGQKPTIDSMRLIRYLVQIMPEHVEAKNANGMTPLQCAFQRYHEDAAKILIETGADQTCRDDEGRNLVHWLLNCDPEKADKIQHLKTMLGLIDKRLVRDMFLQRSKTQTPLAYWIQRSSPVGAGEQAEAVRTVLSYSEGKELGFINGEGDTPLHFAVKTNNYALVEIFLQHDPTLLNRENATGRTPFEMAEDAMIADKCNDVPPMPRNRSFDERRAIRYGLPRHWKYDILRKEERLFVDNSPMTSEKQRVWELLLATRTRLVREGRAKRRLVTLHEANEVARRLAEMKKKGGRGEEDEDDVRVTRGGMAVRMQSISH